MGVCSILSEGRREKGRERECATKSKNSPTGPLLSPTRRCVREWANVSSGGMNVSGLGNVAFISFVSSVCVVESM